MSVAQANIGQTAGKRRVWIVFSWLMLRIVWMNRKNIVKEVTNA